MSISTKQTKANQQNAQKSTGPKTEEGKKVSSQNATKHGLNSVNIVINSPHLKEDQAEYDHLVACLTFELKPQTQLQTHFVYKIANCHWRYRRLINAETAQINKQTHPDGFAEETSEFFRNELKAKGLLDTYLTANSIPKDKEADLLSRYEYRLSRELQNSYKALKQLQAQQKDFDNTNAPWVKKYEEKQHNEKRQNEPISPKSNAPQQDTPPTQPSDDFDRIFDALQKDQPLPPDALNINPVDGFIAAMEKKHGLR